MKSFLVIFAALLTGIGGHFINRRWDRALLFFALISIWLLSVPSLGMWRVYQGDLTNSGLLGNNTNTFIIGLGILWLASVLVTVYDDIFPRQSLLHRWTFGGGLAAVLVTLLTTIVLVFNLVNAWNMKILTAGSGDISRSPLSKIGNSPFFSEYIYFGRTNSSLKKLPEPPQGDAWLTGRFIYQGKPASGVTLTIILNDQYESKLLTTDEHGIFRLPVTRGEWFITLIKTQTWKNKPKSRNDFIVVKGDESRLVNAKNYSRHSWSQSDRGKRVVATVDKNDAQLTLTIRDLVDITWPRGNREPVSAKVSNSVIEWQAYPEATRYLVEASRVERRGTSATYYPVASRQIAGRTSIALSEFKTVPGKENQEYSVKVYAFDDEGRFLSESNSGFGRKTSFLLSGGNAIFEDRKFDFIAESEKLNLEEMQELMRNKKRLDASELLIDEGLTNQANALLKKVNGKHKPGRLDALRGYLAATRGDCVRAKQYFDTALESGGMTCVPSRYRESCN